MKTEINCCHCGQAFVIADAEMCDSCGTHTLACPHCGRCACDKIEAWKREGKIVPLKSKRFDWVHVDLLAV